MRVDNKFLNVGLVSFETWVAVVRASEIWPGSTRADRRGGTDVPMRGVNRRERRMWTDMGRR